MVARAFDAEGQPPEEGIEDAFELLHEINERFVVSLIIIFSFPVQSGITIGLNLILLYWVECLQCTHCSVGRRLFRLYQRCQSFELLRWRRNFHCFTFGSSDVSLGLRSKR